MHLSLWARDPLHVHVCSNRCQTGWVKCRGWFIRFQLNLSYMMALQSKGTRRIKVTQTFSLEALEWNLYSLYNIIIQCSLLSKLISFLHFVLVSRLMSPPLSFYSYCQERWNIYEPSGTYTNTSCLLAFSCKIVLQPLFLPYLPHCEFMNICPAIPNHHSKSTSLICQSDAMSRCR